MKKLCLLIVFLIWNLGLVSANETKSKILIDELSLMVGPQDFVDYVKEIQNKTEINMANPFATKEELSSEDMYYWVYFDTTSYLNGLKLQLAETFTTEELNEIKNFYKNPYHSKYLIHFQTNAKLHRFYDRITDLKIETLKVKDDNQVLVESLINLFILKPLIENEKSLLKKEIERIDQIYSVVKLSNNTELENERKYRARHLKIFYGLVKKYILKSFSSFRKSEMSYMVNMLKNKNVIQKFSSLILTYHYFYLLKYDDIFKNKESLKRKTEEKENYKF